MTTPDPIAVVDLAPDAAAVHALLARRPVFTETSKPSIADVEQLGVQLAAELAAEVTTGAVPADLADLARGILAYGTASLVETTYTPEQAAQGEGSTAELLWRRYTESRSRLRQVLGELGLLRGAAGTSGDGDVPPRRYRSGTTRVLSPTLPPTQLEIPAP